MVGGWRFVYIFFVYVGSGHFFVCVFEIWKCNNVLYYQKKVFFGCKNVWERSGSVVECLTRDRRAAGSSLTGVTALWSLSKTHLS